MDNSDIEEHGIDGPDMADPDVDFSKFLTKEQVVSD